MLAHSLDLELKLELQIPNSRDPVASCSEFSDSSTSRMISELQQLKKGAGYARQTMRLCEPLGKLRFVKLN